VFVAPSWEALYYDLSSWLEDGWRAPSLTPSARSR
jgi:hypothetical protein